MAGGSKHGHAVLEDIQAFSGVRFEPGTLYGALARLEHEGLFRPQESAGRRRPYALSESGRTVLVLYPEGWRERYGAELDEPLDHQRVTPFTLLDLTAIAVYAHRHPELAPVEVLSMSARHRPSTISFLVATVVFTVGWAAVLSVREACGRGSPSWAATPTCAWRSGWSSWPALRP
jgi:Transcriptional regulator PadR-like family